VTLLFNDIGGGYWLYGAAAPTAGSVRCADCGSACDHAPLNHRDLNAVIFMPDLVVLTGGVHIGLSSRATLILSATHPSPPA